MTTWHLEQVYRMRRALAEARRVILADRTALVASCAYPDGGLDTQDEAALAEYDRALRLIDAAIGESDDR